MGGSFIGCFTEMNNLTAIIDFNKWQATGRSEDILSLSPLKLKWEFGWNALEITDITLMRYQKLLKSKKRNQKAHCYYCEYN